MLAIFFFSLSIAYDLFGLARSHVPFNDDDDDPTLFGIFCVFFFSAWLLQ